MTQNLCDYCAEELPVKALKCPHCGEFLAADAPLRLVLEGAESDQKLAALLPSWPDGQLDDAVGRYRDDYSPSELKAILSERVARGLPESSLAPPSQGEHDLSRLRMPGCVMALFATWIAIGASGTEPRLLWTIAVVGLVLFAVSYAGRSR